MENKNAWEKYPEGEDRRKVMDFAEDYRKFISECKTERECVQKFEEMAKRAGFKELNSLIAEGALYGEGNGAFCDRNERFGAGDEHPRSAY